MASSLFWLMPRMPGAISLTSSPAGRPFGTSDKRGGASHSNNTGRSPSERARNASAAVITDLPTPPLPVTSTTWRETKISSSFRRAAMSVTSQLRSMDAYLADARLVAAPLLDGFVEGDADLLRLGLAVEEDERGLGP